MEYIFSKFLPAIEGGVAVPIEVVLLLTLSDLSSVTLFALSKLLPLFEGSLCNRSCF